MTPAELITRRLKARIEAAGATVPVVALLLEALDGEKLELPPSFIALSVHVAGQLEEPLPHYRFEAAAELVVAVDEDKGARLFKENHDALWRAFDDLARDDNCTALGDECDAPAEGGGDDARVFAVDGFQLNAATAPDFQDDQYGGVWTTSFAATVTGRAN